MRPYATLLAGLLMLFGWTFAAGDAVPQQTPTTTTTTAAAEPQGASEEMTCADCHEDEAKAFATNPHVHSKGKGSGPNAVCESCHGDGTAHMEGGGDAALIKLPKGADGSETCVTCHNVASLKRAAANHTGAHANAANVNCLSCHAVHKAEPHSPHLLANNQLALCSSCHATQASSFRNKPFAHKLGKGGMECSSCHDPHARPGRENLRTVAGSDLPCVGCHTDKRNAHVYEHGANAVGDCLSCHEAHGSVNPKQLRRATVAQLCLECHSTVSVATIGSQPPAFHNVSSPRYQNCTTCHVAIHGSNRSPQLLK